MRVLFIVVNNEIYDDHRVGELPLGPGYLASYVKKSFPGAVFSTYVGLPTVEAVLDNNPDIIGISSVTDNFTCAVKMIKEIRSHTDAPIILGGHHISYLPRLLPKEASAGVLFEGENTFLELVQTFDRYGRDFQRHLSGIQGIVHWSGEDLVVTGRRDPIQDLDTIPFPDRDSIRYVYKRKIRHHLMTSRGCPHKCKFCSSHPFWQGYRYFSPAYVVAEIEHLQDRYSLEELHIYDDLWVANRRRFHAIAEMIKERKIHHRLSFKSWVTARVFTPDVARQLAEINFDSVQIGFETGSERILRYLKGGSASIEGNLRAIRIAKEHGMKIGGSFMIGMPGETVDDIEETRRFIVDNELDNAEIYLCKPLPNTEIWDYALEKDLVSEDMPDWGAVNNDDILAPGAIILNRDLVDPETLNRLRNKIQNEISRKFFRSIVRELFFGKDRLSRLLMYSRKACESPMWTLRHIKNTLMK